MDPLDRDLELEEALENIIADAAPESPSIYLNPSGDGDEENRTEEAEVERRDGEDGGSSDGESDNSDDGESDNSDDGEAGGKLTKSGKVYIRCPVI